MLVEGVPSSGIVDSGADITIIGKDLLKRVATVAKLKKNRLKEVDKTPRTYNGQPFDLHGRMDLDISFGGITMRTPVYIKLDASEQLLLSEGVCRQLKILAYHPDVLGKGSSHPARTRDSNSVRSNVTLQGSAPLEGTDSLSLPHPDSNLTSSVTGPNQEVCQRTAPEHTEGGDHHVRKDGLLEHPADSDVGSLHTEQSPGLGVKEDTPIVREETPIVKEETEETPIVEEETPIVKEETEETPIVEEETPIVKEETEEMPIVKEDTPIVREETPIVKEETEETPIVEEETPIVKEETEEMPIVKEDTPIVREETPIVKEETEETPIVEEETPIMKEETEEMPIVKEDTPIVREETPIVKEETEETPIVEEETPIVEEEMSIVKEETEETPIVEEETPIVKEETEETAIVKEDTPIVKEDTPIVKEDTPMVKEDSQLRRDSEGDSGAGLIEMRRPSQPVHKEQQNLERKPRMEEDRRLRREEEEGSEPRLEVIQVPSMVKDWAEHTGPKGQWFDVTFSVTVLLPPSPVYMSAYSSLSVYHQVRAFLPESRYQATSKLPTPSFWNVTSLLEGWLACRLTIHWWKCLMMAQPSYQSLICLVSLSV